MKKVLMFNFDVGSAIEYCGNIFTSWLREIDGIELKVIKDQNQPTFIIHQLVEFAPDIIVLNERFRLSFQPAFYYKIFNPKTKILLINHSWKDLFIDFNSVKDTSDQIEWYFNRDFYKICDIIINLNCKPETYHWPPTLRNKLVDKYFPVDPSFKNNIPWADRENNFLILGSIHPLKISEDFISLIKGTGKEIHLYGRRHILNYESYNNMIDSCKELVYKGELKQEDVPEVLNKYKYFVMPHNGSEVFNLSLLQAILCGTIPLVSNDRNSKSFDVTWIDWAHGLYFGCNKTSDLVENICKIDDEKPNHSEESNTISKIASEKFSYDGIKLSFLVMMKYLIEDTQYVSNDYKWPNGPKEYFGIE